MSSPRLLPPPPQTQARSCSTFRPPPIDGSLTLPELFEWHAVHTPNHRLFVYPRDDDSVRNIYWPEAVRAVRRGTSIIRNRLDWKAGTNQTPVVALLAQSDTISYLTVTMSLLRGNFAVFPISPRNSASAVAHLISKIRIKHILIGREQSMIDLANGALEILRTDYQAVLEPGYSSMPVFEDLFLPDTEACILNEDIPYEPQGPDAIVMILHSSGSTAYPKPILRTNYRMAQMALIPWFGERDLTGQVISLHSLPAYHGMGALQTTFAAVCGLVLATFEPKSSAQAPTPDALFKAAKATNCDIFFCVPSIVESWARSPQYVEWLSTRQGLLFSGGSLNKEIGDYMTSKGVSIFNIYGSTEVSVMSLMIPARVDYDWEYFKFPALITPHMVPQANNTFELVVISNEFCRPNVLNTQVGGVDAYATSDLLVPHPSKAGYWKVLGRTDDQIIHSTGEKTNPGPLESMLNQHPRVMASVMFGRGRFQAGILVDPKAEWKFDPSDEAKLTEFSNSIWPTIERMNAHAPQHSRLFKEVILVAKPSKPFAYTAKSTARRGAILIDYEPEINALYEAVEESTQSDIPPPPKWNIVATADFVRRVVNKVLVNSTKFGDDDDIFQHGCDSLQATWIRNSLLRALRDGAKLDTRSIAASLVYDHPSILRLATFVVELVSGTVDTDGIDATAAKVATMRAMVEKYTTAFPIPPPNFPVPPPTDELPRSLPRGDVFLLTGSTGGLGSHLLDRLASDPHVLRVYALNRPGISTASGLRERQRLMLLDRGLDADSILNREGIMLISGDICAPKFGLTDDVYDEMRDTVTHVIHNAWPVDFNLALASFEPNLKALRSLVDFALSSPRLEPPKLVFTSSIGVFQNIQSSINNAHHEKAIEPELAITSGYTESKWVAEEILVQAAARTSLRPLVVRVGQLCGGVNGAWNSKEWVFALIQSISAVGCVPGDKEGKSISWMPLPAAASALVDFCDAPTMTRFVHLIHPRPVPWSSLAVVLSSELSFPIVTYAEWLARVERLAASSASEGLHVDLRVLRLLPFFRRIAGRFSDSSEAFGLPTMAVDEGMGASSVLADPELLPQLGGNDVKAWLGYWRKHQLL